MTITDYVYFRQEKLEKLAERFTRKSDLRQSWLNEMIQVMQYTTPSLS